MALDTVPTSSQSDGRWKIAFVAIGDDPLSAADVSAIYPAPSLELMYRQSLSFVDGSPELGQQFPGFPLDVPRLVEG